MLKIGHEYCHSIQLLTVTLKPTIFACFVMKTDDEMADSQKN